MNALSLSTEIKKYRHGREEAYSAVHRAFDPYLKSVVKKYHQRFRGIRYDNFDVYSYASEGLLRAVKRVDTKRSDGEITNFLTKGVDIHVRHVYYDLLRKELGRKQLAVRSQIVRPSSFDSYTETNYNKEIYQQHEDRMELRLLLYKLEQAIMESSSRRGYIAQATLRILADNPDIQHYHISELLGCSQAAISQFYNKMRDVLQSKLEVHHAGDAIGNGSIRR